MHSKKIAALISMSADERLAYFVRKTADFEMLWGLFSDGWATSTNASDGVALPLWPERELAQECATRTWDGYIAKQIPMHEFLTRWLPGLTLDGHSIAVFPTPIHPGSLVSPVELAGLLNGELQQYE